MTTATQPAPPSTRLTADEFARRYAGQYVELVDGVVQELPVPHLKHGKVCYRATMALGAFVETNNLGHVMTNDSFVKTASDPDRVRGADVCYFSYERLPKGTVLEGLLPVVPDLVFEVRSPSEGWNDVFIKVGEYLSAGVRAVVVLDMTTQSASVYRKDEFQQIFDNGDDLTIPDVLPGFTAPVRKFFE
ncbi:MAG TPA: Uma2 family endonuclease [Gemmataceae bacterium]|nr:Uma2 family endonuclease [Gemmataceae bacterium]